MNNAYSIVSFDEESEIISTINNINNNTKNAKEWADDHINSQNAHSVASTTQNGFMTSNDKIIVQSATSSATPNGVVRRDSYGRAEVVKPTKDNEIANKKYVDEQISSIHETIKVKKVVGVKNNNKYTFDISDEEYKRMAFYEISIKGRIVATSKTNNPRVQVWYDAEYKDQNLTSKTSRQLVDKYINYSLSLDVDTSTGVNMGFEFKTQLNKIENITVEVKSTSTTDGTIVQNDMVAELTFYMI